MTLTILQNNSGVKVAVLNRKNFQSLVDAALTRKIKPFARVRDPYPQTTIDGRNCSGSITVVNATNRLRTALFNDEEVAVITVNIPTLDACAVTTSYYFRVVRTAFKDWDVPPEANVVRRIGLCPDEFERLKLWVQYLDLDI